MVESSLPPLPEKSRKNDPSLSGRHTHTRKHTHAHTYTHKHKQTHTHKHTNTQTHKHTHTNRQTHKHTHTQTQTHTQTHTNTHKHTHTSKHKQTQANTNKHKQTQTNTNKHKKNKQEQEKTNKNKQTNKQHTQTLLHIVQSLARRSFNDRMRFVTVMSRRSTLVFPSGSGTQPALQGWGRGADELCFILASRTCHYNPWNAVKLRDQGKAQYQVATAEVWVFAV